MISVAIGRSMLKSYESMADRDVRVSRANRGIQPTAHQPIFIRLRQIFRKPSP